MKYYSGIQRSAGIVTVLTCLMTVVPITQAMICYRCTILPPQYVGDQDQPCSKFDGSTRFYQDCPTSTFCMKRIIHYRLPNGTIITTAERNCAFQKNEYQTFSFQDKMWHGKVAIDTKAYEEGCFKGENRGTPNGPSEYCYCSSNYCNKSSSMINTLQICSLLVAMVLLLLGFL